MDKTTEKKRKTSTKTSTKIGAKTSAKNPATTATAQRLIFTANFDPKEYEDGAGEEFLACYSNGIWDDEFGADGEENLSKNSADLGENSAKNGAKPTAASAKNTQNQAKNPAASAKNAAKSANDYEQQLAKKGLHAYYFGKVRGLDMVLMHRDFLKVFWREFHRCRRELYDLKLNRAVEEANPRNATDVLCVVLEELGESDIGVEMNFDNVVQIVKNKHPYLFKD